MSEINKRWKAPTPEFFKKIIKVSMTASAGAAAVLGAEALGQAVLPQFSYTLLPWASIVLKNVFVAGLAAAAIAKLTKEQQP
jgi:hypothetical protein